MSDYFDPLTFNEDEIISKERGKKELDNKEGVLDYRRGMYRVNMRIFDKGVLHHRTIRTNDLGITVKTDVGDFNLNTNWLFKERVSLLMYLLCRLKGIRQNFVTLYEVNESDPFPFSLRIPKVSGGNLNTIKSSTALLDYFKSLFATKFDTRMMIIILAVIGMLGVYFLYSQGYIDLSSIRGLINR